VNFDQLRLNKRIAAAVQASGYTVATPIQQKAIPPAMEGKDVMGLAQTGTGKTAAFALPILERLIDGPSGVLRALILAPTRELAEQIRATFDQLGRKSGLRITAIYGGVNIRPQMDALRRGTDIVVACPGRLLDHIQQRTINLSRLEVLVLDEADMMLDMGFLPDVKRIINVLPKNRQTMMFSATMPDAINRLSKDILRDAEVVRIDRAAPAETVTHALYPVSQHLKSALLFQLLSKTSTESVLVFTRTKHRAKRLGEQLLQRGINAASLQGNMSQGARQAALTGFRKGQYQVLVATDIAARGIDVSQVSHVINFDIPDTTDAYTHRIGRTGRALRTGDAFTLITREDEDTVREIEQVLGKRIERRQLEEFDYSAAAESRDKMKSQPARGDRNRSGNGGARSERNAGGNRNDRGRTNDRGGRSKDFSSKSDSRGHRGDRREKSSRHTSSPSSSSHQHREPMPVVTEERVMRRATLS
jgi:ATP-dependent RNA helicase RhlE